MVIQLVLNNLQLESTQILHNILGNCISNAKFPIVPIATYIAHFTIISKCQLASVWVKLNGARTLSIILIIDIVHVLLDFSPQVYIKNTSKLHACIIFNQLLIHLLHKTLFNILYNQSVMQLLVVITVKTMYVSCILSS